MSNEDRVIPHSLILLLLNPKNASTRLSINGKTRPEVLEGLTESFSAESQSAQIRGAKSFSISRPRDHRSHSGAAATEPCFDICSKLAAGQIAESHRSLWRAERRLLADVDG